jgi:hypothetical protein
MLESSPLKTKNEIYEFLEKLKVEVGDEGEFSYRGSKKIIVKIRLTDSPKHKNLLLALKKNTTFWTSLEVWHLKKRIYIFELISQRPPKKMYRQPRNKNAFLFKIGERLKSKIL